MTGATTWCVVYNGGENSQTFDEEGHSVDPTGFACARRSFVRDLIDYGYLILIDPATITDSSAPAARMAAEEAATKNAAIDAEKDKDEAAPVKTVAKPKSQNIKQ